MVRVGIKKERQNQTTKERQDWSLINKIDLKAVGIEQQCNVASLTKKVSYAKRSATNLLKEYHAEDRVGSIFNLFSKIMAVL